MTPPTTLLLIDDDALILESTRRSLESAGYTVLTAPDGLSGLRLAREYTPELILLDVNLPDISGFEVCQQIKADPALRAVFVVLISGAVTDSDHQAAGMEIGADGYILRPVSSRELLARIQTLLRIRASQENYHALFEQASDGIFIATSDGHYLDVNQSGCDMLGYTRAELLSLGMKDLITPDELQRAPFHLDELRAGKVVTTERAIIRKDGTTLLVEISGKMLPDGRMQGILRDISARKAAEQILRESEARYKAIFEQSPLAINITRGPEFLYANRAYLGLFGFSGLAELQAMPLLEIFSPASRQQITENIERRAQGLPVPTSYESECLRKDGSSFPVLLYVTRAMFSDGFATLTFVIDITARKLLEAALERRAAELAGLQDSVLEFTSPHEIPALLNTLVERATRLLGGEGGGLYLCDPEKQTARCVVSYRTPQDFTGTLVKYGEGAAGIVAQTGQPLIVADYRTWSGRALVYEDRQPFRALVSVPIVWQGQVSGVLHVLRFTEGGTFQSEDLELLRLLANHAAIALQNAGLLEQLRQELAERKQAEAALRVSEARYHSLVETQSELIARSDPAGRLTFVNAAYCRMFGRSQPELLGGSFLPNTLPEDQAITQAALQASQVPPYRAATETRHSTPRGLRWIAWENSAVLDEQRHVIELQAVGRDVTERKQAEARLLEYQDHLQELVRERTAELEIARDQAQAANRAKSDFLAVMSHELRTPLNGVLGLAHLALQTELTEKQRIYLDRIQISGETLLSTINEILDFSKIEAGKLALETIDFSLDEIFNELSAQLAFRAQEKGLQLRFDIGPDVPRRLVGDPARLRQILLNLLGNAVKFTERGQVVLQSGCQPGYGRRLDFTFSIQDTGIGLTAEQVSLLFQPFSQADSSTSRKYGGTGLGLAISQRLVKLMGGEISVHSEYGLGSTFVVSLPFESQAAAAENQPPLPLNLGGKRVLVMESHAPTLEFLQDAFEAGCMRVSAVRRAETGLLLLEQQAGQDPFDLVLVAENLPGELQGPAAVRQIKQQPLLSHIPIILLADSEAALGTVPASDMAGGLLKPLTRAQLLAAIQQALGLAPASQTLASPTMASPSPVAATAPARVEPASLRDRRVLVVEDNEINQLVAQDLLQGFGMQVGLAASGEEALQILTSARFDAILMDIQMPGMDGYQTAAAIRQDAQYGNPHIPIIAMTAHAMFGDRTKALRAGLDDYISKPIDVGQLHEILLRWLAPLPQPPDAVRGGIPDSEAVHDSPAAGQTPATPQPTAALRSTPPELPAAAPVNLPPELLQALNTSDALARLGGNLELYRRLMHMFLQEHAGLLSTAHQALQSGDLPRARGLAHTLKGLAGTLGADELRGLALQFESACAANDPARSAAALEHLEPSFKNLIRLLEMLG